MEGGCRPFCLCQTENRNKSAVRDSLGSQGEKKSHFFLFYLSGKQEDLIDPRNLIFISERFASICLNSAIGAIITSYKA